VDKPRDADYEMTHSDDMKGAISHPDQRLGQWWPAAVLACCEEKFKERHVEGFLRANVQLCGTTEMIEAALVQPFREGYSRIVGEFSQSTDAELRKAVKHAEVLEGQLVNQAFKSDPRLVKRMADFVEQRGEMIADAVVFEFVGAARGDEEGPTDEQAQRELDLRSCIGNMATTGFSNEDTCKAVEVLADSALDATLLDCDGERAMAVATVGGVRLRLKGSYTSRDMAITMQVGHVEPCDLWPSSVQVLLPWLIMVKLLKLTRDNELWLRVDTMDGIVDASKVHVAGGYPVRERLNKLQLRSGSTSGSARNKNDVFFVLPDCIASVSAVATEPVEGSMRELAKQIESNWKAGKALLGDMELRNLGQAAQQSALLCAEVFCELSPANQRATAARLLLEAKQCQHDVLSCPAHCLVERALIGEQIFLDPRPHPAKCAAACRGIICPACLCCVTGPEPHCATARATGHLSCGKAEQGMPLVELSWWFPEATMPVAMLCMPCEELEEELDELMDPEYPEYPEYPEDPNAMLVEQPSEQPREEMSAMMVEDEAVDPASVVPASADIGLDRAEPDVMHTDDPLLATEERGEPSAILVDDNQG